MDNQDQNNTPKDGEKSMYPNTLEAPQTLATHRPPHRFSKENAAHFQAKAIAAKKERELREKQELEQAKAQAQAIQTAALALAMAPDDEYRLASLARTRGQIEKLEAMLDACTEAKDMKALADAIARMRDVEQTLAKRPKPGAFRPVREKQSKQGQAQGPIED